MHIVIEIDEDYYEDCKKWRKKGIADDLETVIANGIPLPKGHGVLKDMANLICRLYRESRISEEAYTSSEVYEMLDDEEIAPTVLEEADKEE